MVWHQYHHQPSLPLQIYTSLDYLLQKALPSESAEKKSPITENQFFSKINQNYNYLQNFTFWNMHNDIHRRKGCSISSLSPTDIQHGSVDQYRNVYLMYLKMKYTGNSVFTQMQGDLI
jgi:hypothetical protein